MTRVELLHLFGDGPLPDEVLLQPTVGEDLTCITDEIISDQDSHLNRPHRPVQDAQMLVGHVMRDLSVGEQRSCEKK